MPAFRRVLLAAIVLTTLLAGALAVPVAASDLTVDQARQYLFDRINTARANNGLAAVQLDARVQDIAQTRSDDMATNHYFGHLTNEQLAAMYSNRGIAWSKIGEILAANDYPALDTSADVAMSSWRNSSTHWDIITDGTYNFAGVGIAKDDQSGDWIWTVEFAREPVAVTKPTVTFTNSQVVPFTASTRKVQVSWAGSPGTYAIKDYKLQYRIGSGNWRTVFLATTRTATTLKVAHGKTVQFRVRARDVQLNKGVWTLSNSLIT
jgi:uncharacterized protein YkwD